MKYITGQQALNLPCSIDTCGDWHTSALRWDKLNIKDSKGSVFGDYGIEQRKEIPEHSNEFYNVANHIRAILDLLEAEQFALITNFNNDYICNDNYTEEIFEKVSLLLPNTAISNFMHKTYGKEWRLWCERAEIGSITTDSVVVKKFAAIVNEESIIDKINMYMDRDELSDICDMVHIVNHYFQELSQPVQTMLRNALEYKGITHFDYVVSQQKDKDMNISCLVADYMKAYEQLGLMMDKKERKMLLDFTNDLLNPFNEHEVVIDLIAHTQGEIYQVADDMGYDLEDFSEKYLNSDFCRKEMDCAYSVYQREFGDACMTMILAEFEEKNITILPKQKETMYSVFWIGSMYRYLFYHLRKYSSELSKEISFKKLSELFFELENCDTKECIEYLKDII